MESVVIILLLVALLLIVISNCVILYILASVIKENSDKSTYLLSQTLAQAGMTPQASVDEMNHLIREEFQKKKDTKPFDPHAHLDNEEYDE